MSAHTCLFPLDLSVDLMTVINFKLVYLEKLFEFHGVVVNS